jgi:L-ascorbate metabolism protein UlaG (beta-lactamase superfamily)
VFAFDSLTIVHLGDLNRVPTQSDIEAIGTVNVALVPVGGGSGLNAAKAAEVISLLEPNLVIPMHYATPECILPLDPLNKFLKEMGLNEVGNQTSLKVTNTTLPEETQVVILDHQGG